ncbi:RRP15-like protein isoform X1 [Hordeum vulgare subsp. vulgare]|uniref:RRP15-like protein isoform X1 n=1 Tax=Hordeum vulgare subsp. vulgare TaxID=112509 RepID=UPI000B4725DA|nr:RRP15-like protein isoform X1 [Hordeum vulgare subsp. vulgare]
MADTPAQPAPAAAAAANPHKRKNKGKGNPNKKNKKLKGPDDATRRRRKPSAKFLKLLEKRARDYNSDDDDDAAQPRPRKSQPRPPKQRDAAPDGDGDVQEAHSSEEEGEASSSGGESDGERAVTMFQEGCRAFQVAFTKIMEKKLGDNPLGPILSADKKLVAAKLAEEADEHKSKGEARKEKRIAAQKGHKIPENAIDNKEKMLIKVATQGVVRLFNEVSKRQTRKGLNPSRSKDVKSALAKHSVPSNEGQQGQGSSKFSKNIGKGEDEPGWAPLRDTYMLGSKLKDWDKAQDSDVAKSSEAPLDNFSDDE